MPDDDQAKEAHVQELRYSVVRSAEISAGTKQPNFRRIAEVIYEEHFGPLIRELAEAEAAITLRENAITLRDATIADKEALIQEREAQILHVTAVKDEEIHNLQVDRDHYVHLAQNRKRSLDSLVQEIMERFPAQHAMEDELFALRQALTRIANAPHQGDERWKRKDWRDQATAMRDLAHSALEGDETLTSPMGPAKGVLEAEIERWRAMGNPEVKHLTASEPTRRQDADR